MTLTNRTDNRVHYDKRHPLRRFIDIVLFIINIMVSSGLLFGYYAYFLPNSLLTVFSSLIVTPLWILCLILFIISMLRYKVLNMLINIVPLLLVAPKILTYNSTSSTDDIKEQKIITYNVRAFNSSTPQNMTISNVAYWINNEKPDIFCLQEYVHLSKKKNIEDYLSEKYFVQTSTKEKWANTGYGLATFSRYPIINSGEVQWVDSEIYMQYCDIAMPEDTIRVINLHLRTTNINQLTKKLNPKSPQFNTNTKLLFDTYLENSSDRNEQVAVVEKNIASSPYKIVICGDFNDVPFSRVYHKLSKNMNDTFYESGKGYSSTYRSFMNLLRIDYILYSEGIKSHRYESPNLTFSDHRPVIGLISINK